MLKLMQWIKLKLVKLSILLAISTLCGSVLADNSVIKNIHVIGNQRISLGTILSYLPVKEGDHFSNSQTSTIIKTLYETGFFSDVAVDSSNGVLTIKVMERPIIATINIAGSNKITKKQLQEVLKQIGLTEGQVFNQAALNNVTQVLVQQYYNLGCYNVKVQAQVTPQPRSRVILNININEGPVAKIKEINITGNHVFPTKELLKNFSLTTPKWWKVWTYFTNDDKYSKDKLEGDLEKLRSFYMDRGYLQFDIDAVQVSLTPDKKHIYIVVHVHEGAIYHISGYDLSGNLLDKKAEMQKFIVLKQGDTFSRKTVMEIIASLEKFVGDYGYAMPNIKSVPTINEQRHQVFINFSVDPGKRMYVRRITFSGNTRTDETVLRREMRQQESAMFVLSKVDESKRRISNLGYLENVDFGIEPVADRHDQIDLHGKVKEAPSAFANFQFGYANADGFVYGASVNEQNFLGTGKELSVQFNNSRFYRTYGIGYYNPYFTDNNISLRTNVYAQTQQPQNLDLSSYASDVYGASMVYGIPLSDYNRLNLGYGYEYIRISSDTATRSLEIQNFLNAYGNSFQELKLIGGWSYNKLDRAIFPTQGFAQSLSLELDAPATSNSLSFYKTNYEATWYYPIITSRKFVFVAHGEAGYGNGIGGTSSLPFFKNYYAGGMGSVRGFDFYTLGPRDSRGAPMGGNVLTVASIAVIFPNPLGESLRTSAFIDVGNVYNTTVRLQDLRSSAGIQTEWRTPLGLLRFSLAKPIRSMAGDRERFFDFAIGTSF